MPVFLQFRLWLAQGSPREKLAAGAAAGIAILLLVLASLPLTDDGAQSTEIATTGPGTVETDGPVGAPPTVALGEGAGSPVPDGGTSGDPAVGQQAGPAGDGQGGADEDGAAPAPGNEVASASPSGDGTSCSGLAASAPGVTAQEVLVGVSIVNLAGPVGNSAFSIRPDIADLRRVGVP